ncbi:ABC transporter permease [Niabella beijingensis]|uniref:ABC transporter permease n=1 Tax=Niabella beijingensis TaxID=2872700 RepID=UPI001CBFBA75|nr:ABC transporter permease [Niabella beijingensis]MBZ4191471.1 ABC transporter permease [Niabella beijingensis]
MIRNYIKTAWRNLKKGRLFATLNIVGLAIGMAVVILIGIWIWNELSFNKGIPNHKRIARIMQNKTNRSVVETNNVTPYPLAEVLRREYGDKFEEVVVAQTHSGGTFTIGDKKIAMQGGFFEEGIGSLLGLEMKEGRRDELKTIHSLLLSESAARSLFGNTKVVGRTVTFADSLRLTVTGVYKDLPLNSDLGDIQFIAPWKLFFNNTEWVRTAADPWRPNAFETYVRLKENETVAQVSALIKDVRLRHVNERLAKQNPQLFLHPMDRWYLYERFNNGINDGGRIQYVWLFGIIGFFVLLLACINFMNLSTARSVKRAREVGVRKTVGSFRWQLVQQFFCESFLYVFLAFGLSLILVSVAIPYFNIIAGRTMPVIWGQPWFWVCGLVFCLITGLLAGIYPALYLSSFNPVKVLKGTFRAGGAAGAQRRVLVVVQFTVSIVLIIGTLMVFRQIRFAKDRPLGYDQQGLVAIDITSPELVNHFSSVRQSLLNTNLFSSIATVSSLPTGINNSTTGIDWPGKEAGVTGEFGVQNMSREYGKTVGWEFAAGRDFSADRPSDSASVILNEAAVRFMGLKTPVGTVITWEGDPLTVIGVVRDLIMESPYTDARPTIFSIDQNNMDFLVARIRPDQSAAAAVKQLESVSKQYAPDKAFHYQFIDEAYNRKFGDEERFGKLGGGFALLAVFISCLGLFGMASFMAEQRIKEIGVRKVLGASVFSLWKLLSRDFAVLIAVSILIAIPLGWYSVHSWLQHYSYRAPVPWWIFVAAAAGAAFITLLTISVQSFKAALANPVKALRSE